VSTVAMETPQATGRVMLGVGRSTLLTR
jgi:hypothetical protein